MKNIQTLFYKLIRYLCVCVCFLYSHKMDAQNYSNYYFSQLSSEQGLSNNNIKSIFQDSFGFIWIGTRNGLNRYDGTSITSYTCYDEDTQVGCNTINALAEDNTHRLWVGTDKGIFIYEPQINRFIQIISTKGQLKPSNWVANIYKDHQGDMWVLIPQQGVFQFKKGNIARFEYYPVINNQNKAQYCVCMGISRQGEIWVGTASAGLFHFNATSKHFEPVPVFKNLLQHDIISAISFEKENPIIATYHQGVIIYEQSQRAHRLLIRQVGIPTALMQADGKIWLGTYNGLYILTDYHQSNSCKILSGPFNLSNKSITTFYQDSEDNIWLGTLLGGLNFLPNNYKNISKYVVKEDSKSLSSKFIRGLTEDKNGNIWIGTEDGGINILNPHTNEIDQLKGDYNLTLCLRNYRDTIYCGLFKKGLEYLSIRRKTLKCIPNQQLGIQESIYSFIIDKNGNKWIGNDYGLYKSEHDFDFHKIAEIGSNWIFDMLEASDGTLWLAAVGKGIIHYDPTTKKIIRIYSSEILRSINSIFQDKKGQLWISSEQAGIGIYQPHKDQFLFYSVKNGLPDNATYKMTEDDLGYLWFGTNKGLVKFNPDKKRVERVYTKRNGLLDNQFNYGAALKAKDGKLYFGGINGLISFYPHQLDLHHNYRTTFPMCISKMHIYNQEITSKSSHTPLALEMPYTQKIELKYNQANISFDIALLDYASQAAIDYYYMMEPIDKEWIKASSNTNISYAQLPPGNYQFHIRAFYSGFNQQPLNTKTLRIHILPPWWASSWAYTAYLLLAMLIMVGGFGWYRRKKEKELEVKQRFFEIEKDKELNESKIKFFTTVAHEFRTPLTLINGPLEMIQNLHLKDLTLNKYLNIIRYNTQQLLDLSNQLLNFYKREEREEKLQLRHVNINQLVEETVFRFEPACTLAKKQVSYYLTQQQIIALVDQKAITQILNNLFSNALKYAACHISLTLTSDSNEFIIRIDSDGEKIPSQKKEDIFQMFYRLDEHSSQSGIGLGLCLSRLLAQRHNGNLVLDSSSAVNSFVLTIPLRQNISLHISDNPAAETEISGLMDAPKTEAGSENDKTQDLFSQPFLDKKYHILIVEDNTALGSFIAEVLSKDFQVDTVHNGEDALSIISAQSFDLILTDLMMPKMDGFQLCKKLKDNLEYSHIPIVILTAKNDLQSKIQSLELGAESYIEKPFSIQFLQLQITSLLRNREKFREAFSTHPFFLQKNMNLNKREEEFVAHLTQQIIDNLEDENFGVDRLAELMNMSRSTLLRKVKDLFNMSIVNFILLIRLKKAAELMETGNDKIVDIGFQVGISSPSYFSKQFSKQFGLTPKEFIQKYAHSKMPESAHSPHEMD